LFKRIAQALPGMENERDNTPNQMIDVNINPSPLPENQGCSC